MTPKRHTPAAALERHLDATDEARLDVLQGLPAHPEHLGSAEHIAGRAGAPPSGWPRRSGRPASSMSRSPRPAAIRSSMATGCMPTAPRPSSSTATTTSSPSTRSTSWTSPPFEPVDRRDGRILARGSSDDKGQIHAPPHGRRGLLGHARLGFPINVRYVFEGEEEISSRPPRPVARRAPGAAHRRRRDHQRHGLLRGQRPGHHDRRCAA